MGLKVPSTADNFSTADLAFNWSLIDANCPPFICTSTTRPSWGATQAGNRIYETDTQLAWWWDGASFHRVNGIGWLGGATGNTTVSTTSTTTKIIALGPLSITVPAGGRTIELIASWKMAQATTGALFVSICRGGAAGPGPERLLKGDSTSASVAAQGGSGGMGWIDHPGAGAQTYGLYIRATSSGGTVSLMGDANQNLTLDAIEL
jgi:hypothetical protein